MLDSPFSRPSLLGRTNVRSTSSCCARQRALRVQHPSRLPERQEVVRWDGCTTHRSLARPGSTPRRPAAGMMGFRDRASVGCHRLTITSWTWALGEVETDIDVQLITGLCGLQAIVDMSVKREAAEYLRSIRITNTQLTRLHPRRGLANESTKYEVRSTYVKSTGPRGMHRWIQQPIQRLEFIFRQAHELVREGRERPRKQSLNLNPKVKAHSSRRADGVEWKAVGEEEWFRTRHNISQVRRTQRDATQKLSCRPTPLFRGFPLRAPT